MHIPPLSPSQDIREQVNHTESAKQEETSASLGASQPSKATHKGTKPIMSPIRNRNPELGSNWHQDRLRANSPLAVLFHTCPLRSGR